LKGISAHIFNVKRYVTIKKQSPYNDCFMLDGTNIDFCFLGSLQMILFSNGPDKNYLQEGTE